MSQPFGIEIKNSHLLRASFGLVALSLLVPGLFQFGPPQWFGGHDTEDGEIEVAIATANPSDLTASGLAEHQPDTTLIEDNLPASEPEIATTRSGQDSQPDSQSDSQPDSGQDSQQDMVADRPISDATDTVQTAAADKTNSLQATDAEPSQSADNVQPEVSAAKQPRRLSGPNTESVATDLAMAGPAARRALPEQPAVRARVKKKAPEKTPPASKTTAKATSPSKPGVPPKPVYVTREFIKHIPDAHVDLPTKQQKENFIGIVLPLILAANEEITQRRSAIMRAAEQKNRRSLETWARLYRVKSEGKSLEDLQRDLFQRADMVPVSLALAQAAIESGWGTSRFARQGNALFGQWAWQADAGLKPAEASNSRAVVRSFPNLFGSVRAYMHNLNTHSSYATFRERRTMLRTRMAGDLGYQLANFMGNYAEIGDDYIRKLQQLIRSNEFGKYETARLR